MVSTPTQGSPSLPSPLAGEGARRADEGFVSSRSEWEVGSREAQPAAANPSSGAARHLLPQGEKGGAETLVQGQQSDEGARRADEGFVSSRSEWEVGSREAQPAAANPSSGATRHLLPQGEKGGAASSVAGETSPSLRPVPHHRAVPKWQRTYSRNLRREDTPEEARLWFMLRGRRFIGFKFRRQVPIGRYIVDFVCFSSRLIIELDGSQHAGSAPDIERDHFLSAEGFRVLRIWNNILENEPRVVEDSIFTALTEPS